MNRDEIKIIAETHPIDWFLHILLGFIVAAINFGVVTLLRVGLAHLIVPFAASNFCIAVELAQFDIFGINKGGNQCTLSDYFFDLLSDAFGILIAMKVFGLL